MDNYRIKSNTYNLEIRDSNADTLPDSQNLIGKCYELTDMTLTIDPRAFETKLVNHLGGVGRIGVTVDVFTDNAAQNNPQNRAQIAWRSEAYAASQPRLYNGPGDTVAEPVPDFNDDYTVPPPFPELKELGLLSVVEAFSFECDPVTVSQHFQTPKFQSG